MDHGRLFLTQHGDAMHEYTLGDAVKGCIAKAGDSMRKTKKA